ncbi:MAG: IS1-like element transposase [Candidatus Bathyarchaeota archaeon]|nr:IS1-like element transposase [Candidatus Termiticorpusculum sp.]
MEIRCPFCSSNKISKNGHNKTGKQVYNCKNLGCKHKNFIETYTHKACLPEIRKQVLKMAIDGTGTRATGRILGISKDTITAILKKTKQ